MPNRVSAENTVYLINGATVLIFRTQDQHNPAKLAIKEAIKNYRRFQTAQLCRLRPFKYLCILCHWHGTNLNNKKHLKYREKVVQQRETFELTFPRTVRIFG